MDINGKCLVIYDGNEIKNSDYMEQQTGKCLVGNGLKYYVCDTIDEMVSFVNENGLTYKELTPIINPNT